MNTKYNGWTNRETWLVNIWFMDGLDGTEPVTPDYLEEMVDEYIGSIFDSLPEGESAGFIKDLIDTGCINWAELADNHNIEIG